MRHFLEWLTGSPLATEWTPAAVIIGGIAVVMVIVIVWANLTHRGRD